MNTDPLGFGGGINSFAYAENDPLARYDSLGLISMYEDCLSRCRKDALLNAAFNAIPGGIFFKAILAPAGLFDFNFLQAKAGYDELVQTSPMDATAGISNMVYTYAYGKATLFDNPGLKGWERE